MFAVFCNWIIIVVCRGAGFQVWSSSNLTAEVLILNREMGTISSKVVFAMMGHKERLRPSGDIMRNLGDFTAASALRFGSGLQIYDVSTLS